jgi:hypothetical protein
MGFFPYMGKILWVFLTFMEVFPIPPLSRGRSGGGWGIYVAVVLIMAFIISEIHRKENENLLLGSETWMWVDLTFVFI